MPTETAHLENYIDEDDDVHPSPPPQEKKRVGFFKNTMKTWTTSDLSYQMKRMCWLVYVGE